MLVPCLVELLRHQVVVSELAEESVRFLYARDLCLLAVKERHQLPVS